MKSSNRYLVFGTDNKREEEEEDQGLLVWLREREGKGR
jgi:hypothetical protein